jgi:phage repressor protein C with HTH and peptisase S24 domain
MLSEKIRQVIERVDVTQGQFAADTGISAERVSNMCRGRVAKLRREEADAIAAAFGVSQQWLVNDTGKMMLSKSEHETLKRTRQIRHATDAALALTTDPAAQRKVQVELFASYMKSQPETPEELMRQFVFVPRHQVAASAGHGAVISDETVVDHLAFRRSWIAQTLGLDPLHLALIDARGDSMSPTIESGDLLLLDTRSGSAKTEGIYVINLAGALLVKRLRIKLSGSVEVMSDNPRYASETISGSELERLVMVGRVVWHGRKV